MLFRKALASMLTLAILFSFMPIGMAEAETTPVFSVYVDEEPVIQGQKGVDFNVKNISFNFKSTWKLNENRSLGEIKVMTKGKDDESFKFDMMFTDGTKLKLTLKNPMSSDEPPYRLIPTSLYTIHIPEGLFIDNKQNQSSKIDFSFVTKGERNEQDLLKSTRPANDAVIQGNISKIEFEYVDNIVADINKLKENIDIKILWLDDALKDPSKLELIAKSIDDFDIQVSDNKLIFQPKLDKQLANFSTYKIHIPEKVVYLKNCSDIANDEYDLSFTTYQMLESTYPTYNQGDVEVKPTIRFVFKHPVTFVGDNKDRIILESQTKEKYPLASEDIKLSSDGKTLSINVGKKGEYPLRRNTLYRVVVPSGVLKLTDEILNKGIVLNFTTRGEGQSPQITRYASNSSGTDDITSLSGTRLARDGNIYICFDRDIKFEKNSDKKKVIEGTKLFKIPKADGVAYDSAGVIYDKLFKFNTDITEAQFKARQLEIGIEDVQIVNKNTLLVKPSLPFINLNQYRLTMDKHLIEDMNGYSIENNIDFYFWTASSPEEVTVKWEGIAGLNTGVSQNDRGSAGMTYTVTGSPKYDPENPIAFIIDGEVLPKAGDIAALRQMSLVEGYGDKKIVKIKELQFEYYFEGNKKKTKLRIYPEESLDLGKYYILTIPKNSLQSRSGKFLPSMVMNFTVAGKGEAEPGIYGIEPNSFKFYDIYRGNAEFTIKGYNFTEDVRYVQLKMISGKSPESVTCAVYKKDIEFKGVTELDVKLRDPELVQNLVRGGSGEYEIEVFFDKGSAKSPKPLVVLARGTPVVLSKDPEGGSSGNNEKMLNPRTIDGTTRYFLKITFDDTDGSLTFDGDSGLSLLQTSTIYSEGQNEVSMLDLEFLNYIQNLEDAKVKESYIKQYIFVKNSSAREAYLYIPVKPMRSQTTYTVMVNSGIVYYKGPDQDTEGNDVILWSFTTTAIPVITGVDMGSVVENYDEDEPIWLRGDFFDSRNVEVMFNDIRARRVSVITDEKDRTLLEVYLPTGRDRLKPGIYTIRVKNDRDHEFEIFGSLSVVEEGEYIPNEEYRVKYEGRIGEVRGKTSQSEDTLILDRYYTDRRYLEVDLDELMGQEVLLRKIQFDGRRRDRIGTLEITSKWADIFIYDVGIDNSYSDEEPELKLGRVEPLVAQNLKTKLARQRPKSELIQVIGEDVRFTSLKVVVPFVESDGDNLKALRYDPYTRNFYEEPFSVDKYDKTVTILSYSSGIFVVVEK